MTSCPILITSTKEDLSLCSLLMMDAAFSPCSQVSAATVHHADPLSCYTNSAWNTETTFKSDSSSSSRHSMWLHGFCQYFISGAPSPHSQGDDTHHASLSNAARTRSEHPNVCYLFTGLAMLRGSVSAIGTPGSTVSRKLLFLLFLPQRLWCWIYSGTIGVATFATLQAFQKTSTT